MALGEKLNGLLVAVDPKFMRLALETNSGATTFALLKIAVYQEDGLVRTSLPLPTGTTRGRLRGSAPDVAIYPSMAGADAPRG